MSFFKQSRLYKQGMRFPAHGDIDPVQRSVTRYRRIHTVEIRGLQKQPIEKNWKFIR